MFRANQRADCLAEREKVTLQGVGNLNRGTLLLKLLQGFQGEEGVDGIATGIGSMMAENLQLCLVIRQSHRDGEKEAVKLRFGEWKSAGGGSVVLGGNDEKRVGESAGRAIDGDLSFIHRLEER